MSNTVELMNAGLPIVAPHAASSMSTTGCGQLPLRLASELVRRQLLKFDPTPQDGPDDAHLVCLQVDKVLAQMGIPDGETCVEIPDRMIQFFAEGD
jgi:hypothetical protein